MKYLNFYVAKVLRFSISFLRRLLHFVVEYLDVTAVCHSTTLCLVRLPYCLRQIWLWVENNDIPGERTRYTISPNNSSSVACKTSASHPGGLG